jgi:glycerol-3-phosphate dehydrogenase
LSDHGACLPATAFERVTVVGGGARGTALALTPARANGLTSIWIREARAREHEVWAPRPAATDAREELASA